MTSAGFLSLAKENIALITAFADTTAIAVLCLTCKGISSILNNDDTVWIDALRSDFGINATEGPAEEHSDLTTRDVYLAARDKFGCRSRKEIGKAASLWRRIEAWLLKNFPAAAVTLNAGVPLERIREVEGRLGVKFPEQIVAFYMLHNGQGALGMARQYTAKLFTGLFGGVTFYDQCTNVRLLPLELVEYHTSRLRTAAHIRNDLLMLTTSFQGGGGFCLSITDGRMYSMTSGLRLLPACPPPSTPGACTFFEWVHEYVVRLETNMYRVRVLPSGFIMDGPDADDDASSSFYDVRLPPSTIEWSPPPLSLREAAAMLESTPAHVFQLFDGSTSKLPGLDPANTAWKYICTFAEFGETTSQANTQGVHVHVACAFVPTRTLPSLQEAIDATSNNEHLAAAAHGPSTSAAKRLRSDPAEETAYHWTYRVRLWLSSPSPFSSAHLTHRKWIISSADGSQEVVSGEGVIGLYPLLEVSEDPEPSVVFEYSSCTSLNLPGGAMEGSLSFDTVPGNGVLEAKVARWPLIVPSFIY